MPGATPTAGAPLRAIEIPPALRAQLSRLRLAARRAHGAGAFGLHASRSRGAGMEFAQYRPYAPGDEPRQIDWKLFARSDRHYVREAERDSPLTAWLLLDLSASMAQHDADRTRGTRRDAACVLAACLAELAVRQGDRIGAIGVAEEGLRFVPAAQGPRHRDRLRLELAQWPARGGWPPEGALRPVWERVHAGELLVAFSDGFDDGLLALLEKLAAARREVVFVQLLTGEERDFPYRGGRRFVDPETGGELLGDGAASREAFLARFAQARAALDARLDAAGIRHAVAWLDRPLDAPLRTLFPARPGA
jgi:uncharacterized protein (DUF58 family)